MLMFLLPRLARDDANIGGKPNPLIVKADGLLITTPGCRPALNGLDVAQPLGELTFVVVVPVVPVQWVTSARRAGSVFNRWENESASKSSKSTQTQPLGLPMTVPSRSGNSALVTRRKRRSSFAKVRRAMLVFWVVEEGDSCWDWGWIGCWDIRGEA